MEGGEVRSLDRGTGHSTTAQKREGNMVHHVSSAYLLCTLLQKYVRTTALLVAMVAVLLPPVGSVTAGGPGGNEGVDDRGAVRLLKVIPVPVGSLNSTAGALYSFDISFVDQSIQTYFLADRSNRVVDVVNAKTATFHTQLRATPDFRGFQPCSPTAGANDCAGPNGVVAAFPWLFVTDAPSRLLTFDLRTNPPTTVSEVDLVAGEPTRADELAYDPTDGLILAINNASTPPVATLVTVNKVTGGLTVLKNILL